VISIDHRGAGRTVGTYLLGQGARRVAIASPRRGNFLVDARNAGVRDVLTAHTEAETVEFQVAQLDYSSGRELAHAVLQVVPSPDAVFAPNDVMAAGVVDTLRAAGRAVPDEVAVIGYDDIGHASPSNDALTTMHHDAHAIGSLAIDLLLRRVNGEGVPEHHVFTPQLLIRQTA
jgi:LacI family transcriptional regulator